MLLVILVVLLGNANKLGNKEANQYVVKDRFAVLEGTMTLPANTSENALKGITSKKDKVLDYPAGFDFDNCVVASAGRKNRKFWKLWIRLEQLYR